MRGLLVIFLAGFMAMNLQQNPAGAAEPLAETCNLIHALSTGGADAGTKALVDMASHWPDDDQIKLAALIAPVLRKFEYQGGVPYLVADLDDNMQEHLVTMRIAGPGMVYLRSIYQHAQAGLGFAHIELQDKYKKIASFAFAQKPEKLSCN